MEKLILIYSQMIKNDNDLLNAVFDASDFLADTLARYATIEIHYMDYQFEDSGRLEDAIIHVYMAILNYSAAVMDINSANAAGKSVLQDLMARLTKE